MGAAVVLSGCVATRPAQVGIVEQVVAADADRKVSSIAADFIFRSETGEPVKFSESRGDITILLFPSAEGWPDCSRCSQLLRLAHQPRSVHTDVTVISLFVPKDSCEHRHSQLRSCEIEGCADLIALCDPDGRVRDLYGPRAEGRFLIIDADGRQVGTGELADLNAIANCVRQAVDEHEAYCSRLYGPQEIYWPY